MDIRLDTNMLKLKKRTRQGDCFKYHRYMNKNNTMVRYYNSGTVAYRLYNTDIVTVFNGETMQYIELNTNGHTTVTTKSRMNEILDNLGINAYVYQKNFVWYLSVRGLENDIPFVDGMKLLLKNGLINDVYIEEYKMVKMSLISENKEVLV